MFKNLSIKTHLVIYLFLAFLGVASVGAYLGYHELKHEANELYDSELIQSANLLLAIVTVEEDVINFSKLKDYFENNNGFSEQQSDRDKYEDFDEEHRLGFQVWSPDNLLLFKSQNLPKERLDQEKNGLSQRQVYEHPWRIYSTKDPVSLYTVITAEPLEVRSELMSEAGESFFRLFSSTFVILMICLYLALAYTLKPLQKLSKDILHQDENNLQPFTKYSQTFEINNITQSLNKLVDKVNNALEREKQLTSDAAHELRTPLAGIKLHSELALQSSILSEKDESIRHIVKGIDRSAHIVSQLLSLSRLEPTFNSSANKNIDFSKMLLEEVQMVLPLVKEKHIDLKVDAPDAISIMGDCEPLRLLMSNILMNAVRYTPENGRIRVQLNKTKSNIIWVVEDSGIGIIDAEKKRVFERFYRVKENNTEEGCGIGLAIVKRVVDAIDANIELTDSSFKSGLRVQVEFKI